MKQFIMWCADKPERAFTLGAIQGFVLGAIFTVLFMALSEVL